MTIDWTAVEDEATRHLQALLRFDTTNPPGNETAAADYIAAAARAEGIEAEVVESAPGRGNAVARLRAANPTARPFLLMGHVDVVSVERDKWAHDPFGGEIVDGEIWGRGALDMKGQVAAELMAMLLLKQDMSGSLGPRRQTVENAQHLVRERATPENALLSATQLG